MRFYKNIKYISSSLNYNLNFNDKERICDGKTIFRER